MLLNVCTVSTFLNSRMSISASKILTQPSYSKHNMATLQRDFLSNFPHILIYRPLWTHTNCILGFWIVGLVGWDLLMSPWAQKTVI